jgi:hypothetical protein
MTKADAIDEWLKKNCNKSVADAAKYFGYGVEEQLIASKDWEAIKNDHKLYYMAIVTNGHQADNRTPEEFAEMLIANWVIEDIMAKMMRKGGLEVNLSGADKNRHILTDRFVTEQPDFEVVTDKGYRSYVELVTDYGLYWKRNGYATFRDKKYNSCRNSNSLILAISMTDLTFTIIDPNNADAESTFSQEWGGKPCTNVRLDGYRWYPLSSHNLSEIIKLVIASKVYQ